MKEPVYHQLVRMPVYCRRSQDLVRKSIPPGTTTQKIANVNSSRTVDVEGTRTASIAKLNVWASA